MLTHLVYESRRRNLSFYLLIFQPKGYYITNSYPHPLYSVDKSFCYNVVMKLLCLQFYRLIKVSDSPLTYMSVPYYKVKFDTPDLGLDKTA